jgi:hypothetical protein
MVPEPWSWSDADGGARLRGDLAAQGWSFFHAPHLEAEVDDPVSLGRKLFDLRPLRVHRQVITPVAGASPTSGYWRNTVEALVHTDGPRFGLPPSALSMMCRTPAADGGDVVLLDTWPLLRAIEAADPEFFAELFRSPRHLNFADASQWGPTFSLRRGHFVCLHPSYDDADDAVGHRFRRWVDRAEKVRLRPRAGDVYVVNNHRCLHGRLAFEDPGRAFVRVMWWFLEPFAAPPAYVERAAAAGAALAARLTDQPLWMRRRFGVDVTTVSAAALERLQTAVGLLANPRETMLGTHAELSEMAELEDTLLACLPAFEEAVPPGEERKALGLAVLRDLRAR